MFWYHIFWILKTCSGLSAVWWKINTFYRLTRQLGYTIHIDLPEKVTHFFSVSCASTSIVIMWLYFCTRENARTSAYISGSTSLQKSLSTHWLYSTKIKGKLCKSLEMFHCEFLKPLVLGMMNKLSYNSLHSTYGWQWRFVIFSAEDSSFILLAPIKILELQLFLDRQFPISSHISLKFLLPNPFKKCYHYSTKSDGKSNLVFCNEKQTKKNPYKTHDMKEKLLNTKK